MVKCVNLLRAPEYLAQIKVGIVILEVNSFGQIVPGKDCPEKLVNQVAERGLLPATRPRARYIPIELPAITGGRLLKHDGPTGKKQAKRGGTKS